MKTNIQLNKEVPTVGVNIVPCKIKYTGPANVSKYFSASKQNKGENEAVTTANFRGLKLVGETIELENHVGYICNSSEATEVCEDDPEKMENSKTITPIAKFDKFTVYGHDSLPSQDNKWKLLSEWQAISDAIHS